MKHLTIILLLVLNIYGSNINYESKEEIKKVQDDISKLFVKKDYSYISDTYFGESIRDLVPKYIKGNITKSIIIKHFDKIFTPKIINSLLSSKINFFPTPPGYYLISIDAKIITKYKIDEEMESGYNFYFKQEGNKWKLCAVSVSG